MIDYTKYRLKPEIELKGMLKDLSRVFVVWCKKCYRSFDKEEIPECEKFLEIIEEKDKIAGCLGIDFLCNSYLTEKKIQQLLKSHPDSIGVISCGLGIQTVAKMVEDSGICVFALSDSIPQSGNATSISGYHGIALGNEKCGACGQCYLGITGGLCPVVDCAKSLLNGPCGGAKDGKCEVNPEKDCVWIEIFKRLQKQKRQLSESIEIRNYNKFTPEQKNKLSVISVGNRKENFYGGLHPSENKELTEKLPVEKFPEPQYVYVFLSQHAGYPAKPLVKQADRVKLGQKIGESSGLIASPVHSPVSGKVIAIEEKFHPSLLKRSEAIIIENDFTDEIDCSVSTCFDTKNATKEQLIEIVKEKGIVGLGGAMFPSFVKLLPPKNPVDTLVINGCECEPYLNSDNRLMIEHPEEILQGIEIARKILSVENVVIGIEENKPYAIESMRKAIENLSGISVKELKTKYPQGAEKMLIKTLLGRKVPDGGLPLDVGVVVFNVATMFAMYQAVVKGVPLIKRVITISGEFEKKGNFEIKIGTPLKDILKFCGGHLANDNENYCLKMGGPMMGIIQSDFDTAVIKGTTGYVLIKKNPASVSEENTCIKCGRCVDVCPMELYPLYYAYYGKNQMWDKCAEYNVKNCIECGCCEYICSSKISLLSLIKKAKKNAYNKT